jgi:ribonuclease HI
MTFFYKNAINVFTDASVYVGRNYFVTAPGFVTVHEGQIINKGIEVVHDGTNNYGELYAIYMGVQELISKYSKTDLFLNIFSDSQLSILSFKEWIFSWYKNQTTKHVLRNSADEPVANQELILEIMRMIVMSGVHISMYHIKGHINSNDVNGMQKFRTTFLNNKKGKGINDLCNVPMDILQEMADYNNIIDGMTRDTIRSVVKNESYDPQKYQKKDVWPMVWFPDREGLMYFKYLTS